MVRSFYPQVPFTHRAIEFKDWPAYKATTPLGQIPVLAIDSDDDNSDGTAATMTIVQSVAILRYLGKLGGLYPGDNDPIRAIRVDSLVDTCSEATRLIETTVQNAPKFLLSTRDWDRDEILAIRHRLATDATNGLPKYLAVLEAVLQENNQTAGGSWLVGDSVTIADLQLYRLASWISSGGLDGIPPALVRDGFPRIAAHLAAIEALPPVREWRAQHPTPYADFVFNP